MTAATVKPADVQPMPVVKTDLGIIFEANFSNCDFPVPGSPTKSKCGSALILIPVFCCLKADEPLAKTTATANLAIYKPWS